MNINDVLKKPVVTEKTTLLQQNNKYVFKIDKRATKTSVKEAINKMFKVIPAEVNIINVARKKKGLKFRNGVTPSWKKAIVTLKDGDKLDLFEN
ncbi:MAG: 50S ribosomal protein L23 [Spirochaetes bacterium]|nr:50S ribosomal protein L23 [Spirochaetota bacterium]